MPSALFEIYQKNFDKTLQRLSGMLELYQNQTKEAQSITLKEIELNISEMERSISQMELEVILEKIPDNKKKLTKIIENNKNIVKQYKREIQDLKYKNESILNKKNLAYIPTNKKAKNTQLNFIKEEQNFDIINFNDEEDTALFIDKKNYKNNNSYNFDKYTINDNTNEEMNLQKDKEIKRINEHNDSDKDITRIKNNNNINISSKMRKNEDKDKDLESNKYKLNKDNLFKKIIRIIFNIIQLLITIIIAFCKNIIYKGYIKLKNYLNHKYGQTNSRRIRMIIFIICFIFIYSFILYIWNSYKMKNTIINEKKNVTILESNFETTNIINDNTNDIDYNESNKTTNPDNTNITNNINDINETNKDTTNTENKNIRNSINDKNNNNNKNMNNISNANNLNNINNTGNNNDNITNINKTLINGNESNHN